MLQRVVGSWLRALGGRVSTAFDRLPIRTRLAGVSALLTFTILCAFALVVGSLTVHRIRTNFNREVAVSADNLAALLQVEREGKLHRRLQAEDRQPAEPRPLRELRGRGRADPQRIGERAGEHERERRTSGCSSEATPHGYRVLHEAGRARRAGRRHRHRPVRPAPGRPRRDDRPRRAAAAARACSRGRRLRCWPA